MWHFKPCTSVLQKVLERFLANWPESQLQQGQILDACDKYDEGDEAACSGYILLVSVRPYVCNNNSILPSSCLPYLQIYLCTLQTVYHFTFLSVYQVYLSASLPVYLSIRYTCLPVYLSTCLPVYLSTCLPVYLSTCLPVCRSSTKVDQGSFVVFDRRSTASLC